jgi:hypothetical protein
VSNAQQQIFKATHWKFVAQFLSAQQNLTPTTFNLTPPPLTTIFEMCELTLFCGGFGNFYMYFYFCEQGDDRLCKNTFYKQRVV